MNKEVEEFLKLNKDDTYLKFNSSINPNVKYEMIGVRIPIIRGYAKELSKKYDLNYVFDNINNDYFEKVLLKCVIISNYKDISYEELKDYIEKILPLIDGWTLCDSFVSSLKIIKKYKKEIWKLINKYLKSNKEYYVRFSLVTLLNYFIEDDYIDDIYNIICGVKLDTYYVKMASSWLLSYLYIYYFDKTVEYFKDKNIDEWTYNKGIQKALESYRISENNKNILRSLKK